MSGMSQDWIDRCNALTEDDVDNFSLLGNSATQPDTPVTDGQVRLYTRARFQDAGIPAPSRRLSCSAEIAHYRALRNSPQVKPYVGAIDAYIGQLSAMKDATI